MQSVTFKIFQNPTALSISNFLDRKIEKKNNWSENSTIVTYKHDQGEENSEFSEVIYVKIPFCLGIMKNSAPFNATAQKSNNHQFEA